MSKEYLPNNWQEYKDAPDDMFIPHTFEELMSWKVQNWELPSSVFCILREYNKKTHKVKEHTFNKVSSARAKIDKLIKEPDVEIMVVDHGAIHHLIPTE